MSDDKKEVIFKESVKVLDHTKKNVEFEAKAGEKRKLNVASANRWIRRDKATDDLSWKPGDEETAEKLIGDMSAPELKVFLKGHEIDFDSKATKPVLFKLAQDFEAEQVD